jgi:RHS repeat-associated protein
LTEVCNGDKDRYRFGFNGQEKVNEWSGVGNFMEFSERGYDSRIGRFLKVDPLTLQFPYNSSYAFAENDVIRCKDLEGGERLDVISNGSPELGRPACASITIIMDYQVVKINEGAVRDNIDPNIFYDRYAKGNTTFYMRTLPTKSTLGVFLEGKQAKWAKEANNGDMRAAKKLQDAGISYYNVDVFYNYNVHDGSTLNSSYEWMSEDRKGRGIIMTPDDISQCSLPVEINKINDDATMSFSIVTDDGRKSGGIGTNTAKGYKDLNVIVLNNKGRFPGQSYTLRAIHEGGHNAAKSHLHNTGDYEYDQEGLQSNTNPYPTDTNTKNIINDVINRSTITPSP